jgi:hypothetical protein
MQRSSSLKKFIFSEPIIEAIKQIKIRMASASTSRSIEMLHLSKSSISDEKK